jgi:hypothetical protein
VVQMSSCLRIGYRPGCWGDSAILAFSFPGRLSLCRDPVRA